MRQHLLGTIIACAAGLALSVQAQSSTSSTGGSSTDPSSSSSGASSAYPSSSTTGSAGSQSGWAGRHLSATGRMQHEALRGSQLTGAQVNGSTGSQIGTISDTIINPASGRLEFAVVSLSGNEASGSSSSTGSTGSTSSERSSSSTGISSSSSLGSGKQVAVPWMLLRPASSGASTSAASSASSTTSTGSQQQPSFTFSGDATKLQSAPNFDASTDLSQPSWRQSVFSYFGLGGGYSGTGAAETPGGSSSSGQTSPQSSSSSSSGLTTPQSPSSSSSGR